MRGRGGWLYWWKAEVCASCEHFRERNVKLWEPRGITWDEDRCPTCFGYLLICRSCIDRVGEEWEYRKLSGHAGF